MFSTKVYPLAPIEQKQLDEFLDENLKSQCICPSKSPMASLVFSLRKRMEAPPHPGLLEAQHNDCEEFLPLPLIPDIFNKVSKAKVKYFTKLDIHWVQQCMDQRGR